MLPLPIIIFFFLLILVTLFIYLLLCFYFTSNISYLGLTRFTRYLLFQTSSISVRLNTIDIVIIHSN